MARRKNFFSFRRRIRVLPGVTLNLSNSGISTTVGVKGASINFGKNGTYLNTGIPGTGFYNRTKLTGAYSDETSKQDYQNAYRVKSNSNNKSVGLELRRLSDLNKDGILSDEEFQRAKRDVLNLPQERNYDHNDILHIYYKSSKKRHIASWLALLTGFLGGHKLYLGKYFQALLCFLLFPSGLSIIWAIIDVLRLGLMSDEKFMLNYNKPLISQLGINVDALNRNSELYDLLVKNGRRFGSYTSLSLLFLKIGILITIAIIAFSAVVNYNNKNNTGINSSEVQLSPTDAECRQIFKDAIYHELMTSICYSDIEVDGFYSNLTPPDFVTYQKSIGCPMADADVAKKDSDITSLAVAKGLKKYPNKEAFCKAELDYFSKIIKKYNEID